MNPRPDSTVISVWKAPEVTGKPVRSVEPVTYALPWESTAIPLTCSPHDSAKACGIDNDRVNNQRLTNVVGAYFEADIRAGIDDVSAGYLMRLFASSLIHRWPSLSHFSESGVNQQITVPIQLNILSALEGESDRGWVSSRLHHKVVFQLLVSSVVDEVDARINFAILDLSVVWDTRAPLGGIVPNEVVADAGQAVETFLRTFGFRRRASLMLPIGDLRLSIED